MAVSPPWGSELEERVTLQTRPQIRPTDRLPGNPFAYGRSSRPLDPSSAAIQARNEVESRPSSGRVLFVTDLFHPVNRFAVELFLNGDMGHRRSWSGAVPMLLARRNPDDVPRPNFLDRASPGPCPATTNLHNQSLAQRVGVPCVRAPGSKVTLGTESTRRSGRIE